MVAESPEEVVYHGTNNSNLFLAEEGDWFEVTDSICYCYQQGLINEPCAGTGTPIKDQQYKDASDELEVEMAVLKAIAKQESKRKSFWSEGQATILFEPHKMWKYLSIDAGKSAVELEKLKQKYPTIVNDQLTNYGAYAQQYKKLNKAKKLHYKSAIKSTSWGKFQVMGFNYTVAFDSPRRMEAAVNQCELQQLKFFIAYTKNINGLVLAMKSKNWQQIAEKYNGPSWKRYNPNYAKHIEKYYYELK